MRSNNSPLIALMLLSACSGAGEIDRPPVTADAPKRGGLVPLPPEAGTPDGPAGTSGMGPSRYDQVGIASWYGEELAGAPTASGAPFAPDAITAAHRTLPLGSHAEVTSLDTGRTIVVLVNDRGPGRDDREIDLSRGAAALLGLDGRPTAPVRVRGTIVTPSDAAALKADRAASARLDTPPALLAALRAQLRTYTPPSKRIAAVSSPRIKPRATTLASGYLVQVGAFSSEDRAEKLADVLGGRVESNGGLHRVRLGPFADAVSAERARDGAARRGYGDATIIVQP
ncbi:septal ring lytic transglycosylase RlpA family protein [Sphingomonas radiodurans]|uniref:septal ring lytic transglycosylase RlpA family protein n=1 Tax=Sphingomonas radiodurans TaxID=2890321 RepID=UPI001E3D8A4F|nr:septal ring lytic transglycosylase RlpA family protein [Sphingomonas radiodurans]WBH16586.1 septal ring lytic transglycosylase RlpA family protein [Sphingomonas radiodurans]